MSKCSKLTIFVVLISGIYAAIVATDVKNLTINVMNSEGLLVEKDLFEYIEECKKNVTNFYNTYSVQKKAIMVLGLTGSGKSTLINYINGVPLVCKYIKGDKKWIIDVASDNVTLTGGFKIGHKIYSETQFPAAYTPPGADFTYIDNPGFRDTRGISVEITNGFFREQITRGISELKFLLLVTHRDLEDRGQKFRDSIKGFSDMLGVFDDEDTKSLSKSIAIVVTRVENENSDDSDMKSFFRTKLLEIVEDEKRCKNFENKNEELVFRQVIEDAQIEIFSNPKKEQLLDDTQSKQILSLLGRLSFAKKSDVKVRIRVDKSYFEKLYAYAKENYAKFNSFFEETVTKRIMDYYTREKINRTNIANIYKQLNDIRDKALEPIELESFLNSTKRDILDESVKDLLLFKKKIVSFLVDLIPQKHLDNLNFKQKWLSDEFKSKLTHLINDLLDNLHSQFTQFIEDFQKNVGNLILDYFSIELNGMKDAKDASAIFIKLDDFLTNATQYQDFNTLVNLLTRSVLQANMTDSFLRTKNELCYFIDVLPEERRKLYTFRRQWFSTSFSKRLDSFKDNLVHFLQDQVAAFEKYIEDTLTRSFTSYFLSKIRDIVYIEDVKEVERIIVDFQENGKQSKSLEGFISLIRYDILGEIEREKLFHMKNVLNTFIDILPKETRFNFPNVRTWSNFNLYLLLTNYINEIKQYYVEIEPEWNSKDLSLTYKACFGRMSVILSKINMALHVNSVKNLNSVIIFATHSLVFDADYAIGEERYLSDAPNLIIISPKVIVEKNVTVNLSCSQIPPYPANNTRKARDGYGPGGRGSDGKPGLPGYNGGNFVVLADFISNSNNLSFISIGGKGGPGQNGTILLNKKKLILRVLLNT